MSDEGESREDRPRRDRRDQRPRDGARRDGPRQDGSRQDGPRRDGPRRDGFRRDAAGHDGPRQDGPRRDGARRDDAGRPRRDQAPGRPWSADRPSGRRAAGDAQPGGQRPRQDPRRHAAGPRDDARRGPGAHEARTPRHADEPDLPEDVRPGDLDRGARGELRTLSKENADAVARHLVMASRLIEDDPALAHRHALAAGRRAGRVAIVRESVAITAYATGDFALAVRELRTFRRISGSDDQIALLVDSERGVGRPDRALEAGRAVDRSVLPLESQAGLAIAMSGARLDLGDAQAALDELERAPVDLQRVHLWSADLYRAFAAVHEELGDAAESARWASRAEAADHVLADATAEGDVVDVVDEAPQEPGGEHTGREEPRAAS